MSLLLPDDVQLHNLIGLIGKRALIALIEGQPYRVWHGSSPSNHFIETKDFDILWHSIPGSKLPDRTLFRKPYLTDYQRYPSLSGKIVGRHMVEKYYLRPLIRRRARMLVR